MLALSAAWSDVTGELMNTKTMEMIAKAIAPPIRKLMERVDALERRAGLDPQAKNLADQYAGVWRQGQSHTRGALVTDKGSLWLCLKDSTARPGSSQSWRLVSKSGQPPRGTE